MGEIWIADTSSIVEVRRFVAEPERKAVFVGLTRLLEAGRLTFPKEVLTEFERPKDRSRHDHGWEWVRKHADHCNAHGSLFDELRSVMRHPQARRVCDPDKDEEEADPYVIALGLKLRGDGFDVTVITEDIRSRIDKMSLSNACGLFKIPTIQMESFLEQEGLLPSKR